MKEKILVGADPELFILNKKSGVHIPAKGIVPGTKEEPFRVHKGAVQVDGTATEFNIDPAASEDDFLDKITSVMMTLEGMIQKFDGNLVLDKSKSFVEFDPRMYSMLSEQEKELGCDPDYNAKTGLIQTVDLISSNETARTAGGHIHVSWLDNKSYVPDPMSPSHFTACCTAIQQLNNALYLPSSIWEGSDGEKRKAMYGTPNSFRPKPYGAEYRSLSSRWLEDERITRWVYKTVVKSIELLMDKVKLPETFTLNENLNMLEANGFDMKELYAYAKV